ncbi:neuropeptides capa receptor [Cephus cinctus]|uniref:Neuropeptides capa receptor n=1 Tax=Cephus cinctus TaxID=211228 RepID=A0AAJ7BSU2_CEPCN|nr:neuropeptides capa receptor [Cephus cinctus]XP_015593514.1 neuropeptides capa receptor [Cephus cinctus]
MSEQNDIYNSNMTESEYLEAMLGPKYLPMKLVAPLTLAYVIIFISGIVGNVATCIVIARNVSMQTATNYYLFSLAISDLTLLVLGLPNELSFFWQQYPWMLGVPLCKIRAYVSEMSSYVSVSTIVAFSMERYLAICHPFQVYSISGLKRPARFILAAWSIAIVAAVPFAVYTKVNKVEFPPNSGNYSDESAICAILQPDLPQFPLYEMSCIVFFLVPMTVILIVYTRMGLRIWGSTENPVGQSHSDSHHVQSRKTIVKMLGAVVFMFFLCWAPFHTQRLLYIYAQEKDYYPDLNEWLYILGGFLYYFSATANPILYNLMSARYREAFKQTLCCGPRYEHTRGSSRESKSTICRCHSSKEDPEHLGHVPSLRCSIRSTINQAKEMFTVSPDRQNVAKIQRESTVPTRRKNQFLLPEAARDLESASPLLGKTRLTNRPSNESSSSHNRPEESLSTASSLL